MNLWLRLFSVIVIGGAPFGATAQDSWIGKSVLHKKPANQIKFGDRINAMEVKYVFSGTWPFTVRDEKEGWLRIHDRRNEGWVDKADFILASEAIDFFTRRIDENEKDAFAWSMRGAAWLQKKELDKAITDFDAAIRLNPKDSSSFNNRGLGWKDKKNYDKAIADFSDAIRINPKSSVAHLNRGITWRLKNDYDKAIEDYDVTIRIDTRYALAFYHRGIAWSLKKQYDKAIKDYDESIRLDPKHAPSFHERAVAWRLKNDFAKAIADHDEAIRLNPKSAAAFRARGVVHHRLKDYAKALADYDSALRLDPKHAAALADQGWLLATCVDAKYRDGKKAVAAARKACELSAFKVPTHLSTLAAAHAEAGDFQEAIRWHHKAMEFPEYLKAMGDRAGQRLKLYEAGMPYREGTDPPAKKSPTKKKLEDR